MNAAAVSGGLKQWLNLWVVNFQSLKLKYEKEPLERDSLKFINKKAHCSGSLSDKLEPYFYLLSYPALGYVFVLYFLEKSGVNSLYQWALVGLAIGFFLYSALRFFHYAADIIIYSIFTCISIIFVPFAPKFFYLIGTENIHLGGKFMFLLFGFFVAFYGIYSFLMLPALLKVFFRTLATDKDRQAHLLFLLSMAALGWGLWLQNGGHWQNMAVLNSPIVVPLLNWKIPFTESLGFLFALLGFVHDPVAGVLSVATQAYISAFALFMCAGVLGLFAEIRLHKSAVGVQPRFALLAFVLFWLAVFVEVVLHWSGAPVLHPSLIVFNRAFAVLAFAVYLFWRRAAKYGEPVRGADGVFKAACDWAEVEGWKIAAWLLGVLWLSTQLSHVWLNGFPEPIQYILCSVLLVVPLRKIIGFKHEFDTLLAPYRNALQLERDSYQPPPVIATEKETSDALGDDDDDDKGR